MLNGKDSTTNKVKEIPKPYMAKASLEDCLSLGKKLRKEDQAEIKALANLNGTQALSMGLLHSNLCYSIFTKEDVICGMFGVQGELNKDAAVWMLASNEIENITIPFLRQSREVINHLNKLHPLLHNVVDVRNTLHLKWLEWCGFTFINKQNIGYENKPFYSFVRTCVSPQS